MHTPGLKSTIAALVLAAGQSKRMGKANKLLADINGRTMIEHTVSAIGQVQVVGIWVVLGHQAEQVRSVLANNHVQFIENPNYAQGLSTSLQSGIAALPSTINGFLVCLGDMPAIKPAVLDQLISCFDPGAGRAICVPVYNNQRGNPILWARRFIPAMLNLRGDQGAKMLLQRFAEQVHKVPVNNDTILLDIDTTERLAFYKHIQ